MEDRKEVSGNVAKAEEQADPDFAGGDNSGGGRRLPPHGVVKLVLQSRALAIANKSFRFTPKYKYWLVFNHVKPAAHAEDESPATLGTSQGAKQKD